MEKKNPTVAIFQQIANSVNDSEDKVVKEVTPKIKQPITNTNASTSIYNNIMNTLETETKGGNNNGQQQQ